LSWTDSDLDEDNNVPLALECNVSEKNSYVLHPVLLTSTASLSTTEKILTTVCQKPFQQDLNLFLLALAAEQDGMRIYNKNDISIALLTPQELSIPPASILMAVARNNLYMPALQKRKKEK